ncbi:MAG: branched-chain amino acid ABC transporter permease [Pseudomonadota bacterium]
MDFALFTQFIINGLMQGMVYALVAVGFTLFFGVLDIIKFSHGDVLTVGAFAGLTIYLIVASIGIASPWVILVLILVFSISVTALLGAVVAKFLVIPLKQARAPALNILLITLMLGTALREAVRLFFPDGSSSKAFPALLPGGAFELGMLSLRFDSILLFATGVAVIIAMHTLITRTKLGLAIQAVAQDEETSKLMGINFEAIVLMTFMLGSAVAAIAGIINGLYYNEINFTMGLLLGAVGFSAAIIGGLGNLYGAILGGFLFAGLQTFAVVVLPIPIAYKDVFAFGVIIILIAWRPTGLIAETSSERV